MASTTAPYNPASYGNATPGGRFGVAAATLIHTGHLLAVDTSGAGIVEPATPAANRKFVGVSTETVDNSAGSAGDLKVPVEFGMKAFDMKSGDEFDNGDAGAVAYVDTSKTVKKTAGSNSISVGRFMYLADDGRAVVNLMPGGY